MHTPSTQPAGLSWDAVLMHAGRHVPQLAVALLLCAVLAVTACKTTSKQQDPGRPLTPPPPATEAERLGDQYMTNNMAQAAIPQFEKALAAGSGRASVYWRLGNAYFSLKKWPEALDAFRQAIAADPSMAIAHEGAGYASFELGRFDDAIVSFEQAAELAPAHWVPHAFLAVLYRLQDKNALSQQAKEKTLSLAGEQNKLMAADTIRRALNRALALRDKRPESDPDARPRDLAELEAQEAGAAAPSPGTPRSRSSHTSPTPDSILDPLSPDMDILGLDDPQAVSSKSGPKLVTPTTERIPLRPTQESTGARNGTSPASSVSTAKTPAAPAGRNATSASLPAASPAAENDARSPGVDRGNADKPDKPGKTADASDTPVPAAAAKPAAAPESKPAAGSAPVPGNATAQTGATPTPSAAPVAPVASAASTAPAAANATTAPSANGPAGSSSEYVVSTPVLPKSLAKAGEKTPASAKAPAMPNAPEASGGAASPGPSGPSSSPTVPGTPGAKPSQAATSAPTSAPSPAPASADVPATQRTAATAAGNGMIFSLLESSWKSEDRAIKRANDLRTRGVDAKIMQADLGNKGLHYRVMIGSRQHREDIEVIKSELRKRFGLGELVILRIRSQDLQE